MHTDWLSLDSEVWRHFLAQCPHDLYHTPSYAHLSASHTGSTPIAFYAERGGASFLMPLLLRRLPEALGAPETWRDAISPYGYASPLFHLPTGTQGEARPFFDAFTIAARTRGIVSAFVRMHPLFPLPLDPLREHERLIYRGRTVYIDLHRSPRTLCADLRSGHRYDVRRIRERRFYATVDDWSYFPTFINLYRQTMERVGAASFYFFSDAYFMNMRRQFGHHLHLSTVHAPDGTVVAAALFSTYGTLIQYLFSGSNPQFQSLAPTKLLLVQISDWAKQEGYQYFHLGGGIGGREDTLFQFKTGFSSLKANFYTLHLIPCPESYLHLVSQNRSPDPSDERARFFPAYRSPD